MIIIKSEEAIAANQFGWPPFDGNIAFVPTMGALHNGHLQLVRAAKAKGHRVVVSIFVNPTQFNDASDFAQYPTSTEQDILLLETVGTDLLMLPSVATVYPNGTLQKAAYPLGHLDELWEGEHRPGHFQGVCQVVHRLLKMIQPGHLYMGQKDYQQCKVVQCLLSQFSLQVQLTIVPTIREESGLAMSSRNRRLDAQQLQQATTISQQLRHMAANAYTSPLTMLRNQAAEALLQAGFNKVDYIGFAHAHTLQPLHQALPGVPMVILVAAWLGKVRLIDNWLVPQPGIS